MTTALYLYLRNPVIYLLSLFLFDLDIIGRSLQNFMCSFIVRTETVRLKNVFLIETLLPMQLKYITCAQS